MDNKELADLMRAMIERLESNSTNHGLEVEVATCKLYMAIMEGEVDRL